LSAPTSPSAYRQTRAARSLALSVSPPSRIVHVMSLAGGLMLAGAGCYFVEKDVEVRTESGCVQRPDTDIGCPIAIEVLPPDRRKLLYMPELWALIALALAGIFAPVWMKDETTLTLDEGSDRLTLRRARFLASEETVRPLAALSDAVVVSRGRATVGQLVLANGERLDLGPSSRDAAHAPRVVDAIQRFVPPRTAKASGS